MYELSDPTTLWQGINKGILFFPHALAAARIAFGSPIFSASYL